MELHHRQRQVRTLLPRLNPGPSMTVYRARRTSHYMRYWRIPPARHTIGMGCNSFSMNSINILFTITLQ